MKDRGAGVVGGCSDKLALATGPWSLALGTRCRRDVRIRGVATACHLHTCVCRSLDEKINPPVWLLEA